MLLSPLETNTLEAMLSKDNIGQVLVDVSVPRLCFHQYINSPLKGQKL